MVLLQRRRLLAVLVAVSSAAIFTCYLVGVRRPGPPTKQMRSYKYILQWNSFFNIKNLRLGPVDGNFFEVLGCPRSECIFTEDRSLKAVEDFDAVLFHMFRLSLTKNPDQNKGKFPATRSPHQRYIFFMLEAPPNAGSSYEGMSGIFNWTMTYRLDSDIWMPYGVVVARSDTPSPAQGWLPAPAAPVTPSAALDAGDSTHAPGQGEGGALVAWLVSDCKTQSRREVFVDALSKHIRVDVYGKCGKRPWPKNDTDGFYRMLSANYTFYLSFENSLCRDYVTEKLFNVLPLDVVPVVYGGANYSAVAPPHSYINARDFASPLHLARYLLFLARRPDELAKFFWWKRHYQVVPYPPSTLCGLCARLHDPGPPGSYQAVGRWYNDPGTCEKPRFHWR